VYQAKVILEVRVQKVHMHLDSLHQAAAEAHRKPVEMVHQH
jgi:hypothetical protein